MSSLKLALYYRFPYALRMLAASAYGLQLRWWRYGGDSEALVAQAAEREHWSEQEWQTWRERRLDYVLNRAATQVPYYRDQWQKRRAAGDKASWAYLENWPILEKSALRATPRAFVAEDCDTRHMMHEQTSGTSGTPLSLWWSVRTVRQWYALFEARWRLWYGVSRRDRWAILGGQLVAPVDQTHPPFWVWNAALKQLYLSSYHLSPEFLPAYLDVMKRVGVKYLYGYSSSVYTLAQYMLRHPHPDLQLKVVLTNAEPLYEHQREVISEAFHCPVRETYGMSEQVAGASECEHGSLHYWPEVGVLEVLNGSQPLPAGETGDFVCTSLLNIDMPLIRYRLGDHGALSAETEPCACGRTLPRLARVEGRLDDVLYTADGRRIGRLDPVFKTGLPIREAQIVQEDLDRFTVRFVPAEGYLSSHGRTIVHRLQARVGAAKVVLEPVDSIPRGANGKFRAVVCNLPEEMKHRFE